MKQIGFIFAATTTICLFACSSNSEYNISSDIPKNDSDIELLTSDAQKEFLYTIDSINNEFNSVKTRASVESFSRWGLLALADGVGGCVGAGVVSWFTSAACSAAYDSYLTYCQSKMSRTGSIKNAAQAYADIMENKVYTELNRSIVFQFCGNCPKSPEDSIGYVHNQILNSLKIKGHTYNFRRWNQL